MRLSQGKILKMLKEKLFSKFFVYFNRLQFIIDKKSRYAHQEVNLKQTNKFVIQLTWILLGTTGFAITWLSFAQTDEVIMAEGKLQPIVDVSVIQLPVGGVLDKILVREGQEVKRGEKLLILDNEASIDKSSNLEKTLNSKDQQLKLKGIELEEFQNLSKAEEYAINRKLLIEIKIMNKLKILSEQGGASEIQLLTQINKVNDLRGQLEKVVADRPRQILILRQEVRGLEADISEIKSKLTESRVNVRYQEILSPVDGVVFDLQPTGPGFVGRGSDYVMQIVPYDSLQAEIEINSTDIGFVRVGKPVEISIDSFPASDFGVLEGTLTRIGSDALPPDELNRTSRFPAIVDIDSQQLKLKNGESLRLQVGMSLKAYIKLRKVTYLQLLLGQFRDKASSLRQI